MFVCRRLNRGGKCQAAAPLLLPLSWRARSLQAAVVLSLGSPDLLKGRVACDSFAWTAQLPEYEAIAPRRTKLNQRSCCSFSPHCSLLQVAISSFDVTRPWRT